MSVQAATGLLLIHNAPPEVGRYMNFHPRSDPFPAYTKNNKIRARSFHASMGLVPSQNATPEVGRRSVEFHPTVWGDRFLKYTSNDSLIDANVENKIEELKAEVRKEIITAADRPLQKLELVDVIQQLGLAYHFETEIQESLQHIYGTQWYDNDLYHVSLRFRLLRQEGYNVSCDVFKRFRDDKNNFKEALTRDVRGMLSLYEAAHLRVHGEDILDEAVTFCVNNLKPLATSLLPPLATQISHALKRPIRKGVPRLEARHYISIYQEDDSHDETLLKLAKLDYNKLLKLHQKELGEITKWWKDLNFESNLPFKARDRVVECYFWILAVHIEPECYQTRMIVSKLTALISIVDDIYDVYGTIEELNKFTEAIERWDMDRIDELPEYMRILYQALLEVVSEIREDMAGEGKSYRKYYTIEAMKDLARNYFAESKWLSEKYVPTLDEYLHVSLVSSGYPFLITASFATTGDIATKESFEWAFNKPKSLMGSAFICRVMDDIASHNFEQGRGHVASAVECYMKTKHVNDQEACEELDKQVTDAWKDINQESLEPLAVPMPLLTWVLNYARAAEVIYADGDAYTFAETLLKDHISSLVVDPIAM